jgi:translocation and assembly module TamA
MKSMVHLWLNTIALKGCRIVYFGQITSRILFVFTITFAQLLAITPAFTQSSPIRYSVKEELLVQVQSISLLAKVLIAPTSSDVEILAAAQADYQRIILTLYESGYYNASINIRINGREAAEYSPFDKIGAVKSAEITVNEGRVFLFGTAQITPLPEATKLSSEFAAGQIARSSVIGKATDAAIDGWREHGRPKAKISDQKLIADHAVSRLDVRIQIESGSAAKFGSLAVTGNKRMRPNRIRKIAGLPEGDIFTLSELTKAADRLRATGIFSSVRLIEADEISAEGDLDVTADVVEAKLRRVGAGASISSDEGASVEGYWLHRNLIGGGEQLRFDANVTGIAGETSGVDYEIGATLIRPATLTPDTHASLNVNFGRDVEPNYTLQDFSTGLNFDHRFFDTLTGSFGVTYSNIDTADVFGQRNFSLLSFPIGLAYDTRNDKLSANDGIYLSLDIIPFLDLKDTHSGARVTFDGRAYKGLGAEKSTVLAGRLQFGSLIGPDLQNVPSDFLFYSGGGGTVRGQDFQSLGVTLPGGQTVGGKSFVGISAELRRPIKNKFDGVLFADFGYIGRNSALGTNGDNHAGVGFGLRFKTGIGPIRFDLAVPANRGSELDNLNFYIGIGQAF